MTQLFDLYVYDATGTFVGVDPDYTADAAITAAQYHLKPGFTVKIVNTDDGTIVQTFA